MHLVCTYSSSIIISLSCAVRATACFLDSVQMYIAREREGAILLSFSLYRAHTHEDKANKGCKSGLRYATPLDFAPMQIRKSLERKTCEVIENIFIETVRFDL